MTCYWSKRKLISYLLCAVLEILRSSCICLLSMDLSHSIFCSYTQDQKNVFVLPKANNDIHYEPTSAPLVSWNRHTLNRKWHIWYVFHKLKYIVYGGWTFLKTTRQLQLFYSEHAKKEYSLSFIKASKMI